MLGLLLWKIKKGVGIVNVFQKIVKKCNQRKPNKVWVYKGSEFYSNSFKRWLKDIDIKMHLIHNKGKSVAAERFIRTLKPKIYKYTTSISKNVYIDKLDDIANEYNNIYHRTKIIHVFTLMKKLMIKILSLKLVIT